MKISLEYFFSSLFFFFSFRDELLSDHGISSEENEVIEPKRKSPRSFGRSQRVQPSHRQPLIPARRERGEDT